MAFIALLLMALMELALTCLDAFRTMERMFHGL
jgi:hypothetical protein